jgi:hypothetical protein
MSKRAFQIAIMLSILSSCSDSANEAGPGGVSSEDAKALDDAAAKLDSVATNTTADQQE